MLYGMQLHVKSIPIHCIVIAFDPGSYLHMMKLANCLGSTLCDGSYAAMQKAYSTVEPHLSDSCLSVPSIIRNAVQKFLKQVIRNC